MPTPSTLPLAGYRGEPVPLPSLARAGDPPPRPSLPWPAARRARRRYERVTLLGESLGTLAMGHLLTVKDLPRRGCVRLIARGGEPAA
jgi:hypothetical protein